ncbi:MAG: hypothetical protein AMXMBFR26_16690 [Porticoccaceae bacterium]
MNDSMRDAAASLLGELSAGRVIGVHADLLDHIKNGVGRPTFPATELWAAIEDNHRCNIALWDEEDQARRRDVPDSAIVRSKRLIDGHNQRRNDAVERMDELILAMLPEPSESAWLHSETVGAMIDRLSILCLKIYHMDLQTRRADASAEHRELCRQRLVRLREQREDLGSCLDELLKGCAAGALRFKVYRQFKMYNDPRFNTRLA